MKPAVFSVLLSALVVCAGKTNPIPFKTRTDVVPNKFIVEVEATSQLRRRFGDLHPLDAVYHEFRSRSVHVQVTNEFKIDGIFNGATVIVDNAEHLSLIKNTPGVKAVRPMKIFLSPKPTKLHTMPFAESPNTPDRLSSHILAGVDKVHAEGNIGKGVKIGIIDSGVDYNHPAFGSKGFGPGKKFAFGYDFVGDNFDGITPNPKADFMDCYGHGTHVAGILAAEPDNPFNISGVAYGATFGMYKVFGCDGETTDEIIMQALHRGVEEGMDILTLSLGVPTGWASSSTAVVANGLANNGTIITVAAGNDGFEGSWDASSPASGRDIIAVGSVDNSFVTVPYQNATVQGAEYHPIAYSSSLPFNIDGSLPIFATSDNTAVANDFCSPLTNAPDLSKHLVIIQSGDCYLSTKLQNAEAKGAKAFFFYQNGPGLPSFNFENYTAAFIQAADAEFLVKQFAAGAPVSVSFPKVGGSMNVPDPNGGLMSDFSSYGPSFDFEFKPSFSAPGGNILSTYPTAKGSYALMSGTSMSTPFVAGGIALLLAANKSPYLRKVNATKILLETTSTMIRNNNTAFDTLSKAGAGLMNVYKAIHSTTLVSPGELILNDTAHFQGQHVIIVQNNGNHPKSYTLKHVPALTAMTIQNNSLPAPGPVPLVSTFATVDINPTSFTLQPGVIQEVVVKVAPPTGLNNSLFPVYSGFVEVTSGLGTWHSSYIGLAANLKDMKIFDNTTSVVDYPSPSIVTGPQSDVVLGPTTFTFKGTDFPTIFVRFAVGVAILHTDLVQADFQLPDPAGSFSDVKVIGTISTDTYLGRNDLTDDNKLSALPIEKPVFIDGTKIPNGQYRILIRALKITGDPNLGGDYESWLSPIININAR